MRSQRKAPLKGLQITKHMNIMHNLPDVVPMNFLICHSDQMTKFYILTSIIAHIRNV